MSSFQAVSLLEEVLTPRKDLPPLLLKLNERPAERLDYLGVSYGLTPRLLKYVPVLCTVLWLPLQLGSVPVSAACAPPGLSPFISKRLPGGHKW